MSVHFWLHGVIPEEEPTIGPRPESDESTYIFPSYFLNYALILSSHRNLGLPTHDFPSGLSTLLWRVRLTRPVHAVLPSGLSTLLWRVRLLRLQSEWSRPLE
jgi:hypothetical protein